MDEEWCMAGSISAAHCWRRDLDSKTGRILRLYKPNNPVSCTLSPSVDAVTDYEFAHTSECVKSPVLTIQHFVEKRNIWDHASLVYNRNSKNLRLAPGDHLDEIDFLRHTSIDIHNYKHRNIFPRRLTAKETAAAEQASLMRTTSSNVREVQTRGNRNGQGASMSPAIPSARSQRKKRRAILEDSGDEHAASNPSGSLSSGHQAAAATDGSDGGMSAEANAAPGDESSKDSGQQAGNEELEKALQKVKALEARVRQQELQIARPSSTTTDTGAHTCTEGNPTPGDASGEQQIGDGEPEKTPMRVRTLEDMVRQQGVEITELKLRLADGMGQ